MFFKKRVYFFAIVVTVLATIPSVANPTVAFVASPINRMGWLALYVCLCLRIFLLLFLHGITHSPTYSNWSK